MNETLTIARLGAQGDGIADIPAGPVYVPFTLPGEVVEVAREGGRARLLSILEASEDRIEPVCRHFGVCGGCSLQHLAPAPYLDWKRASLALALASRGIEATVEPTLGVAPASRRRAVFSARRRPGGAVLGYNRAASHDLFEVEECPILLPAITSQLDMLRRLAALVCPPAEAVHLAVTSTASGLDIAVDAPATLSESSRKACVAFGMREDLARLTVAGELIVEAVRPVVMAGGVSVSPPAGGFLQAVEEAETAMAALAGAHLGRAKKVADLFAGVGAFTFRLAARAAVHAVESDAAALAALDRAARGATGLKRITHERRDLVRRPLTAKELSAFDGVLFDPPRAGAEDQSRQIARSDVPLVVAVSCNPATLARDLRILLDGGYRIAKIVPVDQFLWSAHVEAVALLEKPRRPRRR
jgi:23S rRNA (uracil1939-C5)-methyltransferase